VPGVFVGVQRQLQHNATHPVAFSFRAVRGSDCIRQAQANNAKSPAFLERSHLTFKCFQCLQVDVRSRQSVDQSHPARGCRCTNASVFQCSRSHFAKFPAWRTLATAISCSTPMTCATACARSDRWSRACSDCNQVLPHIFAVVWRMESSGSSRHSAARASGWNVCGCGYAHRRADHSICEEGL
jgi:hypothetical protein